MSYSIPSFNKILTLTAAPFLSISDGALSVCEFAMVQRVYILLCPQKGEVHSSSWEHRYTHSAAQSSKRFKPLPVSNYYDKVIVELENTQSDQEALWNSYLFLISVNVYAIFSLRDCQQITFIMLNRFSPLRKLPPTPTPLFLTNKTKLDGISRKIKWKIHVFWYIVFQVLKLLLIKKYKIELVKQFLYFLLF